MIDLWLYEAPMATVVDAGRGRSRLTFREEAIARWGLGSRVFSIAAPLSTITLTPGPTAVIVEGLLPEGDALARLKGTFNQNHPAKLLGLIGRESLGAVIVVPEGEDPPGKPVNEMRVLSEGDVAVRLRSLPQAPLGVAPATGIRLSLAGAQPKLPLHRSFDGTLSDPTLGRPSTVILKVEPSGWPRLVEMEAYGMAVMKATGVPTPDLTRSEYEEIPVLEVDRFDRVLMSEREIERVHQEDLCMGLGARPAEKYASSPNSITALRHIARAVYDNSRKPDRDLSRFILMLVTNIAIGNCDAHARNYSLIHYKDGSVELTPAYDVVPDLSLPQP